MRLLIIVSTLLLFATHLTAQEKLIRFSTLGTADGLSQSTISCIFQDSRGFIWFGTRNGLNRYDGYKFHVYKNVPGNPGSISHNVIMDITEDADGNLWIATDGGGLNVFDRKTQTFQHFGHDETSASLASNFLNTLAFDKHGVLWIGTDKHGVDVFDPKTKKIQHHQHRDDDQHSLSDNTIKKILCDHQGDIWIATVDGLNTFNRSSNDFAVFKHSATDDRSLSNDEVWFLFEDSKENLWIATYGGGVNLFEKSSRTFKQFRRSLSDKNSLAYDFVMSIAEDERGQLWFGTENEGLSIYNPTTKNFQHVKQNDHDNSNLSNNSIDYLFKDVKGNMWVGTYAGGINFFNGDGGKFNHYAYNRNGQQLSNNSVLALYEDAHENLWITTDGGGLNRFDRSTQTFEHFRHDPANSNSIAGDHLLSICEDKNQNLWIGTWGQGITRYNPTRHSFKHFTHDPNDKTSLSSSNAWTIYCDRDSQIWVGSFWGGLDRYDAMNDCFIRVESPGNITTLLEDREGFLWIGTNGSGLIKYDKKNKKYVHHFLHTDSRTISSNDITCLMEDRTGNLWIGSRNGLNTLDKKTNTIKHISVKDGLPNEIIAGVLEDENGNLWVSSNRGISKIDVRTMAIKNFTLADGLQGYEFREGAFCKSKSGLFYFGGVNGFNEFNPGALVEKKYDPPIVFTDFQLFNKSAKIASTEEGEFSLPAHISESRALILSHKESVISVEFASLNFTNSEKKQYAYRLVGFDDGWNYIGTKNSITYTNLDPGHYTLQVKGLTNEGDWSARLAELQLTITPPFWRTVWFNVALVLFALAIVVLIFYQRVAAIKARNRYLKKEVEKRTHELTEMNHSLTESNEEISLQNETLEDLNKEITRQSDKILEQQEHIVTQNQQLEKTVQKLETTNDTKDKFFSILAHDLKNPVYALTGITDLVSEKFSQLNSEQLYDHLQSINKSSHAVYGLLVSLLDWARTQTNNINYTPTAIPLHDLALKSMLLLDQQVKNKNISLHLDVDPSIVLFADYQMIDTVLRNLMGNSIKFTPTGGKIYVTATRSDEVIKLTIRDTGMGMTEAQRLNLFNIAHQHTSPGTHGEMGTGLGLIVCKEFIEANKGTLEVESETGKGSSFTMSFPRSKENEGSLDLQRSVAHIEKRNVNKAVPEKILKMKGKRVLIVDDHAEIRTYLKLLLSGIFEIFEAENGADGIKVAMEIQPALIISDMVMPVMDGVLFCEKIKNNIATCHIPIIMLTSQDNEDSQLTGYQAGASVYLTKPVSEHILFQVMSNFIHHQEHVRQRFTQAEEILPDDLSITKIDEDFLNTIVAYVEKNLADQDLDYTKICALTNTSRTVLYAKFKALTGQGVHDFIKTIRLKKSIALLLKGELNVTQIAYDVGFNTPSYFTKSFVKQYGITPKEYVASVKRGAILDP